MTSSGYTYDLSHKSKLPNCELKLVKMMNSKINSFFLKKDKIE